MQSTTDTQHGSRPPYMWLTVLGERLYLKNKHVNPQDDCAVAIIKDYQIVDHIPKKL